MKKSLGGLFIFLLGISNAVSGQEMYSAADYQAVFISNPGLTGLEGDGFLRLSYSNHYPGNNFNLHSAILSYDGYFPALHGGAGFYLNENYLGGIINDFRGGFSYSYIFQAGRDLYISAGLSASFFHRGYDYSEAVLPDQIDPLLGAVYQSGENLIQEGRNIFDLGTGFMVIAGPVFAGIAVSHLARPDLYKSEYGNAILSRSLLVFVSGDAGINRQKNIMLRPLGEIEIQKERIVAGAGGVIEINHLAFNTLLYFDNSRNIDLQAGFSLNFAKMRLSYNYQFNISSSGSLLPFTLLHEAGVAIGLNNVDKRKTVKTINFPKL